MGKKFDSYTEAQKAAVNWQAQQFLERAMDQAGTAIVAAGAQAFLERQRESIDPDKALKLYNASQQCDRWNRKASDTGQAGKWDRRVTW